MQTSITRSVQVNDAGIIQNGEAVYSARGLRGTDMLIDACESLGMNYPKFYKMDNLCKLAIIGAELLLRDANLSKRYASEDVAVIASTCHSSLDTDMRYWQSTATAPSPSLFVYTLPNVMLGEICIRWQIRGENTCFVQDEWDIPFQVNYVDGLLRNGMAEVCISFWADYFDGAAEAFFMLVEKNEPSLESHNPETIQKLYR